MASNKKILVAVDKSQASDRVVRYVADMVGGKPDISVGLFHLELPPKMLEWGGSEKSDVEEKVSREREKMYEGMEQEEIRDGQGLLKRFQRILADKEINVTARLVQFEEPLDSKTISSHIVQAAKEQDYGTVVVGWHSFSGLKRLFQRHLAEELIELSEGLAIWVVE